MDTEALGRVALMSIHPAFAGAILRGEKRVEFRKRPLALDVTHIIVYATQPVRAVVGAFSVEGQETAKPEDLWLKYCDVAGIDRCQFDEYYEDHSEGTSIQIGEVLHASPELRLDVALGLQRPPQSFQYVEASSAQKLIDSFLTIPCSDRIRL